MKFRAYFSPFFLTKYYIYREISEVTKKYNFSGTLLDVGCGEKPYRNLFADVTKYSGIDFRNYSKNFEFAASKPDYYFGRKYLDNYKLPFKNESFDNTVAFQVLEHHANPTVLIAELYRVTRKNGYIFLTVPFMGGVHEEPHDYQRFTEFGLQELFKPYKYKLLNIGYLGSIFSTISMLLNEYLCCFVNKGTWQYILGALVYPPFFIFQYLCLLLDKLFKSKKIVTNYSIIVQKS